MKCFKSLHELSNANFFFIFSIVNRPTGYFLIAPSHPKNFSADALECNSNFDFLSLFMSKLTALLLEATEDDFLRGISILKFCRADKF